MTDLRCKGTLHAILSDDKKYIEVKCKRRTCGARKGLVVLHTIALDSGKVVDTRRFADPKHKEGK